MSLYEVAISLEILKYLHQFWPQTHRLGQATLTTSQIHVDFVLILKNIQQYRTSLETKGFCS